MYDMVHNNTEILNSLTLLLALYITGYNGPVEYSSIPRDKVITMILKPAREQLELERDENVSDRSSSSCAIKVTNYYIDKIDYVLELASEGDSKDPLLDDIYNMITGLVLKAMN